MADLLRKKPKPIERGVDVSPKNLFSMNEINDIPKAQALEPSPPTPAVDENLVPAKPPKRAAERTTTVRVSIQMKNKFNALVTMGIADSIDQLAEVLFDEFTTNILSKDEKKQLEIILDMYRNKTKNNK